jgi:hypothetical protein
MRITEAARKRGIADADMLHALRNFVTYQQDQGALGLIMFIGPATDGTMLEVGVLDHDDDEEPVIVHAMRARRKYWP